MSAPAQTCVRCRSRRTKCDLRLPKCGSCRRAGVECLTVDLGLGEKVPRSYIHSLQQRVQELEERIRLQQDTTQSSQVSSAQEDEASIQEYDYMGLGTSLTLFDQLSRLPALFPPATAVLSAEPSGRWKNRKSKPLALPSLPIESDNLLPPTVQRHLLNFFFDAISTEFPPVFSQQQRSMFLLETNTLLVSPTAPNTWLRIILLSIYSISARVLSRDFYTDYSYLENICLQEVNRAFPIPQNSHIFVCDKHALDRVTILCLCIIHELVGASRNKVSSDVLNAAQTLLAIVPYITESDEDDQQSASRLAFFLSQVEALLCLHFKRPSAQYTALRSHSNHAITWLDVSMEIVQLFQGDFESRNESSIESVSSLWDKISRTKFLFEESTLLLKLYLHPAFSSNLAWLTSNSPSDACPCSITLLNRVAQAARSYLEYIAAKQESQQPIICISLALERALQAGFVWVIYILYSVNHSRDVDQKGSKTHAIHGMSGSGLLEPLICCQSILLSLSEMWKPGRPYYLVWNMVHNKAVNAFMQSACNCGPEK